MIKQILRKTNWNYDTTTLLYKTSESDSQNDTIYNSYKQKQPFNRRSDTDSSKITTLSVQNPSLPLTHHYSSVTADPNNYPTNTTSVNNKIGSPVKKFCKTNYPPSF